MTDTLTKRRPTRPAEPLVYRLDLTIGRTSYAIEPLAETLLPGTRAYRLIKLDGTIYDVAQTSYGPQCDCPDYLFRRDGLDPAGCKHIRALVGSGLIDRGTEGAGHSVRDRLPMSPPRRAYGGLQ